MSVAIRLQREIVYPESDGQPMAENTQQFRWIVLIKENLETLFQHDPQVFVAGDLLWDPVQGEPETRRALDAMVVFGQPKGDRRSYRQWDEDDIAPQVVFEILSPSNILTDMVTVQVIPALAGARGPQTPAQPSFRPVLRAETKRLQEGQRPS